MLLCPPVAVRATDLIMEGILLKYDILALASFLLDGPILDNFLGRYLRDLKHPRIMDTTDPLVHQTCNWHNEQMLRVASQCLPIVAASRESLFIVPKKESSDCISYCPRCLVQLLIKDTTCPDCGGVELVSFTPTSDICKGGDSRV